MQTRHHRGLATALAGLSLLGALSLDALAQSRVDVHRDAATRHVGQDDFMRRYARAFYCNLADNNNQIVLDSRGWNNTTGTGNNAQYRIPLTQIFDDVWFVGNHYVGQYLIRTPSGLVLADAANNANEAQTFIYPALQTLGMSASYPLKAVFLTHGHGDHDGGASWLKNNTGAEVFLGSADISATKSYAPTPINSSDLSMRQLSVGGKTIWVLPTPGHTPGSTSAVFEVMDHGKPVRVLMNGGQSMSSTSVSAVAAYLDSIERTYAMVKALNVEGVMTPHIYWDGEGEKLREIMASGRTQPSQHVYGHESVVRQMVIARECSAAWLSRMDATTNLPVWRYNTVAFLPASPTTSRVAVKLSNPWGPLPNQSLTFKNETSGATCTATTDATGVASCASGLGALQMGTDKVSVSFAGARSDDFVDLPATSTATVHNGCADLTAARRAIGARAGTARYVSRLDTDANGLIDVRDIASIGRLMTAGTVCP